ncbi:MAG: hypothetical protein WCC60_23930 [Ilumatobacteraceae bacterium]
MKDKVNPIWPRQVGTAEQIGRLPREPQPPLLVRQSLFNKLKAARRRLTCGTDRHSHLGLSSKVLTLGTACHSQSNAIISDLNDHLPTRRWVLASNRRSTDDDEQEPSPRH